MFDNKLFRMLNTWSQDVFVDVFSIIAIVPYDKKTSASSNVVLNGGRIIENIKMSPSALHDIIAKEKDRLDTVSISFGRIEGVSDKLNDVALVEEEENASPDQVSVLPPEEVGQDKPENTEAET